MQKCKGGVPREEEGGDVEDALAFNGNKANDAGQARAKEAGAWTVVV